MSNELATVPTAHVVPAATTPVAAPPDKGTLIKMYLHMRDVERVAMVKRHKKELAEHEAKMRKLEDAFTGMFNRERMAVGPEKAQTSISTPLGRANRDPRVSYTVKDAAKYKAYLAADAVNRISMAHARVSKDELEQHLKAIGAVIPRDGIDYKAEVIPGVEAVIEIRTKFSNPPKTNK